MFEPFFKKPYAHSISAEVRALVHGMLQAEVEVSCLLPSNNGASERRALIEQMRLYEGAAVVVGSCGSPTTIVRISPDSRLVLRGIDGYVLPQCVRLAL